MLKKMLNRFTLGLLVCLMTLAAVVPAAGAAVTFKDAQVPCAKCSGTGKKTHASCNGTGQRRGSRCGLCSGTGRFGKCLDCSGNGYTIDHAPATSSFSAAKENTFVGKIGKEKVVGYLDNTWQYRLDGATYYTGDFVIYDSKGSAAHKLTIRVQKGSSTKTYTSADKYAPGMLVWYYPALSRDEKWSGNYTSTTDEDWVFTWNRLDDTSDGVFSGTVDAVLKPDVYDSSKNLSGEVRVTGAFSMQMQSMHTKAEKYRKAHSSYDKANPQEYNQTTPADIVIDGPEPPTPVKIDHTCRTCKGSGVCTRCAGLGWRVAGSSGTIVKCARCGGSSRCPVCYGVGKIY